MSNEIIWNFVPQSHTFVAMDYDGCWYSYLSKPILDEDMDMWRVSESSQDSVTYICENIELEFPFEGNWQDSLQSRKS